MEKVYRAFDWTIFSDEKKCRDYEQARLKDFVIMFDWDGNRVNNFTDEAVAVLHCTTPEAAKAFFELYHNHYELPWDSAEEVDVKYYFWHTKSNYWIELPYGILDAIINFETEEE